jgi:hypothetical protein
MADKNDKAKKPPPNVAWHAVTIVAGSGACAACTALGKRRFLSKEAPRLPLADCTSPARCKCAYRHHKDRRDVPRRWADEGGVIHVLPRGERRDKPGRREKD